MSDEAVLDAIAESGAKFVDFRFTGTCGEEKHITVPSSIVDAGMLQDGKMIDGSSVKGWQPIDASDLIVKIDPTAPLILDPFYQETTLIARCNVLDPITGQGYERDPRSLAIRAENYLRSTGIADQVYFGPEPEFFIFDEVRWKNSMEGASYQINSEEGAWSSGHKIEGGNIGHRPVVKGGYFPVPPVDSFQDLRSAICLTLEGMGIQPEAHHHEVATAGQGEIAIRYGSLVKAADWTQLLKYTVRNIAHNYGKTATFMPKPLVGDNGSGMHCHQSLSKDGVNLFAGDGYAGLSDIALYYIGGIIKHARALNALTNPTTVSYKRLVPGFEAPVLLAYSSRNRSAAIRIPFTANPKGARIEVRFPDPMANPYLAFSAMLMAGLDGIENKILPSAPIEKDLYNLPPSELADIPTVCASLEEAVHHLHNDHAFLRKGGVFTELMIESYIKILKEKISIVRSQVHPIEFELYYSC